MKYILNTGRYAVGYLIKVENKPEIKIELDKRRYFQDTGNLATTGITAVEDDVYTALSKLKDFERRVKAGELTLVDEPKSAETTVAELQKENAELKAKLEKGGKSKTDNKEAEKQIKEQAAEIASLKAQLEAYAQNGKAEETTKENTEESF